jgi:hypothetical protein
VVVDQDGGEGKSLVVIFVLFLVYETVASRWMPADARMTDWGAVTRPWCLVCVTVVVTMR